MATRKPVRVLPEPVGAAMRVSPPERMSGQPSTWGGVGPSGKRLANQAATAGWNPSRGNSGAAGLTLLRVPGGCSGNAGRTRAQLISTPASTGGHPSGHGAPAWFLLDLRS